MTLDELAVLDWTRLIRGLAAAGSELAAGADRLALAMAERMLQRAAREGAQALAWAGHPLELTRITGGAGGRARAAFAAGAELAGCSADVPVGLAQVHRTFAAEADRRPALVAMFIEAGRRAEHLVEQFELAGASEPAIHSAAQALARALPRAHLQPFKPHGAADFDRVRAVSYSRAGTPGHIVEVRRSGLVWRGHLLRKADVIVSDAPGD